MYTFRTETDFEQFDRFVEEHHGQYQQCSLWPQVKTSWKPHFYAGFDGSEERVLTCLVLERNLPLAGKLWYVPYGTVSDITNETLQKEFAEFITKEMKAHKAFCTIIDPPVALRINGESQEEGHAAHKLLTSIGYKLNADLPSYTYKHPVQTLIPLRDENGELQTGKQLLKNCEKGVRYSVRVGESRGLTCETYSFEDIEKDPTLLDAFVSVMDDTSERNDFVHRDNEYLKLLFGTLKDYTDIMIVYYDKAKDTALQNARLEERAKKVAALETAPQKKIKGLTNDIDVIDKNTKSYQERMDETKDYPEDARIPVAGGLTIRYGGFANCVFGGTRNIVRNNTRSSHYMNYLRLLRSIDLGMDYHDLGYVLVNSPETMEEDGSLGALTPNEDFVGISKFKLSFGARYTEYIGEYILVGDSFRYWLYKELMPKAKKTKMTLVRLIKNR